MIFDEKTVALEPYESSDPKGLRKSPAWARDELILALDLYMLHRTKLPSDTHPDVIALSVFLNRLAANLDTSAFSKFRNPNGVAMKLQNFRRLDPTQTGKGLKSGGREEVDVWAIFSNQPERLAATASSIRDAILSVLDAPQVADEELVEAEEGRVLTRLHRTRERDKRIVERRKAAALKEHGSLRCEACDFDFFARYGARGSGFIECHHTRPVSSLRVGEKTKIEELALLCANCHRMIHVARPWLSLEGLRAFLSPLEAL